MKSLLLAFTGFLAIPAAALGGEFESLAEARKISDQAIELFNQEKFSEGYDVLKPYWPLPVEEIDALATKTKTQWTAIKERLGASVGIEFVEESRVGNSLARYVYLLKFKNHALRWIFVFYRPTEGWVVNGVAVDDRTSLLFEKQ